MLSYDNMILKLQGQITELQNQINKLKKYPPNQIYLTERFRYPVLVRICKFYAYKNDIQRNRMVISILASNINTINTGLSIYMSEDFTMTPVPLSDLPLYLNWKYKSDEFEKILKEGKI